MPASPDNEERRPRAEAASHSNSDRHAQDTRTSPLPNGVSAGHCCQSLTLEERQFASVIGLDCATGCVVDQIRSGIRMRAAQLRVNADQTLRQELDFQSLHTRVWVYAQLRDFADLLEVAEREGWLR